MGGTDDEVSAQRALWKSLPRDLADEQLALNRSEAKLAAPAFANIIDSAAVAPMASPQTCGGAYYWSYYKLRGDGLTEQCFAGAAGTHTLANPMSDYGNTRNFRLQAADYKGRTYYRIQTTYFWTVTRGPGDNNWYEFPDFAYDQHMYLLKVQLY